MNMSKPMLTRLRRVHSLEGVHAVLLDKYGGRGLHVGRFSGGGADHHDKHVRGSELVERIAWADRRIHELARARDNMVAVLEGREPTDTIECTTLEDA